MNRNSSKTTGTDTKKFKIIVKSQKLNPARNPRLINYWRSDKFIVNIGDYISDVIIKSFGYSTVIPSEIGISYLPDIHDKCLWAVGTLFQKIWIESVDCKIEVWGSGYGGDKTLTMGHLKKCNIFAVRGPLTRRVLGLKDNLPLGDPALLLSLFYPISNTSTDGPVSYIPHFNSINNLGRNLFEQLRADQYISISCDRSEFWETIRRIVTSRFVLTSSLHGAIIAQAYNIPWALCVPEGTKVNMPVKWLDWFEYLGIEGHVCHDFRSSLRWWAAIGRHGRTRDLTPLIDSFPHS